MTLRSALSVLSKSSPFSVKTVSERTRDEYDDLKDWLYVEQEIERDFRQKLSNARPGEMLFLCGSSGDGKSEILTRAFNQFRDKVKFHLDATHSFQPHQSAIDALNDLFREVKGGNQPLVLGINIGMIGNYVQEGGAEHDDIKSAMQTFLDSGRATEPYFFFNFENYPKFQFTEKYEPNADFAKKVMRRLTEQSEENPFFCLYRDSQLANSDSLLLANYTLLMREGVQDMILANLFKARLVKDQFMTARALLDFLHHLLTGPGYLFDNLFSGSDNELVSRVAEFDPALGRTRELDQFVLRYELNLAEPERDTFLDSIAALKIDLSGKEDAGGAASLIRLFYLLQNEPLGNDYHKRFQGEFDDRMFKDYARVWRQHCFFDGSAEAKTELRKFYANVLISGIFRYANRNAPELAKDEIFLGEFNGVKVASVVELKADYATLEKVAHGGRNVARFEVAIKVGDAPLKPITFNINLYSLLVKLNQGYRPNKYDKNAVVLLEDVVEQIREVAKRSDRIKFYRSQKCFTAREDDGVIETSGAV